MNSQPHDRAETRNDAERELDHQLRKARRDAAEADRALRRHVRRQLRVRDWRGRREVTPCY